MASIGRCTSSVNYTPRDNLELSMLRGQRFTLISREGDFWYIARNSKGREGYIPSELIAVDGEDPMRSLYAQWSKDCDELFKRGSITVADWSTMAIPPAVRSCSQPSCRVWAGVPKAQASSVQTLGTCVHDIERFFRCVPDYGAEWLRHERLRWHPDRFRQRCTDEAKDVLGPKAASMFATLTALADIEPVKPKPSRQPTQGASYGPGWSKTHARSEKFKPMAQTFVPQGFASQAQANAEYRDEEVDRESVPDLASAERDAQADVQQFSSLVDDGRTTVLTRVHPLLNSRSLKKKLSAALGPSGSVSSMERKFDEEGNQTVTLTLDSDLAKKHLLDVIRRNELRIFKRKEYVQNRTPSKSATSSAISPAVQSTPNTSTRSSPSNIYSPTSNLAHHTRHIGRTQRTKRAKRTPCYQTDAASNSSRQPHALSAWQAFAGAAAAECAKLPSVCKDNPYMSRLHVPDCAPDPARPPRPTYTLSPWHD
ncbi:MAG: SH3 domain-containing protein, partial [Terriglobus roseus]|nr:SH3 domain-containing protein [Terriglobus roseus]